jgi:hypothetical protein
MSIRRHSELVAVIVACGACGFAGSSRADEDALAAYRDRFRQGMDRYKAGAMAEAIRIWSAIYEEIGAERGYRLSFDLARAYEANFETSRAAERYQSFLDEVARRRAAGESLDDLVEREEKEARDRLADLDAANGRIRVLGGSQSVLTQIDTADPRLGTFVSYVAPGGHVVVFAPGSEHAEHRDVTVKAGEIVDVAPTPRPALVFTGPEGALEPGAPRVITRVHRLETAHPFSPVVLYVAVGTTAASVVVPIVTYAHAYSLISSHNDSKTTASQRVAIESEYPAARTEAYASLALPIALGAVTVSLVSYYFAGSKEREVRVAATPLPGGGAATLSGAF